MHISPNTGYATLKVEYTKRSKLNGQWHILLDCPWQQLSHWIVIICLHALLLTEHIWNICQMSDTRMSPGEKKWFTFYPLAYINNFGQADGNLWVPSVFFHHKTESEEEVFNIPSSPEIYVKSMFLRICRKLEKFMLSYSLSPFSPYPKSHCVKQREKCISLWWEGSRG